MIGDLRSYPPIYNYQVRIEATKVSGSFITSSRKGQTLKAPYLRNVKSSTDNGDLIPTIDQNHLIV